MLEKSGLCRFATLISEEPKFEEFLDELIKLTGGVKGANFAEEPDSYTRVGEKLGILEQRLRRGARREELYGGEESLGSYIRGSQVGVQKKKRASRSSSYGLGRSIRKF